MCYYGYVDETPTVLLRSRPTDLYIRTNRPIHPFFYMDTSTAVPVGCYRAVRCRLGGRFRLVDFFCVL